MSCTTRAGLGLLTVCAAGLLVATSVAQDGTPQQPRRLAPPPAPPPPSAGVTRTERAYPTGDRGTSVLLLERFTPAEVRRGEPFSYELRLTNLTRGPIENLIVTEQIPPGLQVSAIRPEPTRREGNRAIWEFRSLRGGSVENLVVSAATQQAEPLEWCATAAFGTSICTATRIVEPRLALLKTMPPEAIVCDEIPIRLVVTNTGSGVARNVVVSDELPAGLVAADGRPRLVFDAGNLAAGQSREFTAVVKARQTGEFRNVARAAEGGGPATEAAASVRVRQPVLALSKRGPDVRYLGRPATFELLVRNTGDAPARDTVVEDRIPAGLNFVSADQGGQFAGGVVRWNLGVLGAGEGRTLRLDVSPVQAGRFENTAVARAYCAQAQASAVLEVRGVPAILLEVVDVSDPIEVGGDETYEIIVVNQGSATGTNIAVTAVLPPEMQFVNATGPTIGTHSSGTVTFAPLAQLAPRMKATYQIMCRGVATGDVRFRVSMRSDQTTSPVEETESTHIY